MTLLTTLAYTSLQPETHNLSIFALFNSGFNMRHQYIQYFLESRKTINIYIYIYSICWKAPPKNPPGSLEYWLDSIPDISSRRENTEVGPERRARMCGRCRAGPIMNDAWRVNRRLVGGLVAINIIFPEILGISSSQLTNSYFSEGWPNHQPEDLMKRHWPQGMAFLKNGHPKSSKLRPIFWKAMVTPRVPELDYHLAGC